ncbi:glycoside hydrolase family 39 protein [Aaosphaeria arxii CBS 175.79]|uniref:Glycoside hydrolase family 39 protein n=1 Tax=Aaosphaeria arxii CBS 175.79 TaxID=1450172 RepID=A0A6A5Y599_9PLEO|nr:glycoside hydrolase family 39 protein [Aaosphaeria arxii CBS 175.79]KAF2020393.1 glycoside hydrolase family 39 protein [Aaosphaeria arxii CBS 175.79]
MIAVARLSPRWTPDNVAVVDLAVARGPPQYHASGIIYGILDAANQIPDSFYTDIGLHWFRAGGAQMDAPNRGWVWGELDGRWASALSNYLTVRKYDGKFQLLLHNLWGTDHADESMDWPGDDGDWSDYDKFLDRIVENIIQNEMTAGLHIDIWNEPEWGFWKRPQSQWLDLFGRTYHRFRNDPQLNNIPIIGPSLSLPPSEENTWWTNFLRYVAANGTAPDHYSWHHIESLENPANDLQNSLATFDRMRNAAGAPARKININEYLNLGDELNPAATVWHLSRLERYDTPGLRANWRGGPNGSHLRDFLASLIWRDDPQLPYHPNGDWQALKYYKTNMTGHRVATSGSNDRKLDVYATVGDKVRVLAGVRVREGTWGLTVKNLDAVGLPASGQIGIQTWGFTYVIPETLLLRPSDRGVITYSYDNNEVTFPVHQYGEDLKTAWAFEIQV